MILIIAEKAQAAKKIANALSEGKPKQLKKGRHPYYEIKWKGEQAFVVPLRGHIMGYDFPKKYNSWSKVDPRDLISVDPRKQVRNRNVAALIKKFDPDRAIHACDADPEGENIGFEALDLLDTRGERAWFSSLTKKELKTAFDNLKETDVDVSKSIDARMIVDLLFGAVLTREVTMGVRRRKPISVGRCQTPTLRFLVEKELEIKKFKSKKFWQLIAVLEKDEEKFEAKHKHGRFYDKEEAKSRLKKSQPVVTKVKSRKLYVNPPKPLNTTALLRGLNSNFNISASKGMKVAEALYLAGHITYPRTDTNKYKKGIHKEILEALKKGEHGDYAKGLLKDGFKVNNGKKDVGDHPPIMPTSDVPKKLSGGMKKVYDFVVRRYLATLSPRAVTTKTKVELDIGGEPFVAKGRVINDQGFMKIYPYTNVKIVVLPPLEKGDKPILVSLDMQEGETQPPRRYSEGTLLRLMEKKGIGTKSTRQNHIETLKKRGYATVMGKTLGASFLGIELIKSLDKSAKRITLPDFTRTLEEEMEDVAEGKKKVDSVVGEARKELKKMVDDLRENKEEFQKELKDALYKDRNRPIGECPSCGKSLVVRKSRKGSRFVGCSGYPDCKQTYSLPQKGYIKPKNEVCEKCGTPLLSVKTRRYKYDTCLTPECENSIWAKMKAKNEEKEK